MRDDYYALEQTVQKHEQYLLIGQKEVEIQFLSRRGTYAVLKKEKDAQMKGSEKDVQDEEST